MAPGRQCERCRSWISLDLDAELSEFEAAVMRRHLRTCAGCRAFARDVRAATALVRAARPERPEAPVSIPAVARRARVLQGRPLQRLSVGAAIAAASVAAVFGSGITGDQRSEAVTSVVLAGANNNDLTQLRALRRAELHPASVALQGIRIRVVELD
jgi:predicted anti-sigma-YlaC factor YlaD